MSANERSAARPLAMLATCILLAGASPPARAEDEPSTAELMQLIRQQGREIQELRRELNELRGGATAAQPDGAAEPAGVGVTLAPAETDQPDWQVYRREDSDDPTADTSPPGIRLEISGQINQAMNVAGDGKETKVYFVDNDTSNTRLRFAGVATFEEGPEIGPLLEIAFSPNPSSDVSQDDEIAGDFFQVRRAELYALDERYGRITFGRGSSASDNTAEFDLSLVSGAMYSGIADVVGGLFFTDGRDLTDVRVNQAFFNFDGNRQNRIRYDTPMWGPAQLSVSVGADQQRALAITFGGDYDRWTAIDLGDFTTLGAFSVSQPNEDEVDLRFAGSWSVLHDPTGLSLSVSGGWDTGVPGGTPYNVYGKLGWNTQLLRLGPTGFGVDYTWTENVDASGDQGQGVGLAAVQVLERYGIEFYSQVRWYMMDRDVRPNFDDIVVGTVGTRVRF